jgi:hypothetical protein
MTNLTAADIDALLDGLTNCILTRPELAQRLRGPQRDQGPAGEAGRLAAVSKSSILVRG